MLTIEERETHISFCEIDAKENPDKEPCWDVYTTQMSMMRKLERAGIKPYKIDKDKEGNIVSKNYKLPYKQLIISRERKKVEISEERRLQLKEHMASLQEKRKEKHNN